MTKVTWQELSVQMVEDISGEVQGGAGTHPNAVGFLGFVNPSIRKKKVIRKREGFHIGFASTCVGFCRCFLEMV